MGFPRNSCPVAAARIAFHEHPKARMHPSDVTEKVLHNTLPTGNRPQLPLRAQFSRAARCQASSCALRPCAATQEES